MAWLIIQHSVRLAGIGVVVGLIAAIAAARLLIAMLYGVQPYDPSPLLTACGAIAEMAIAATWLPAWRAVSVDPNIVLRDIQRTRCDFNPLARRLLSNHREITTCHSTRIAQYFPSVRRWHGQPSCCVALHLTLFDTANWCQIVLRISTPIRNRAIVMDTRAKSRGAHAGPIEDRPSFPPLAELALALPWKMVQATRAFLRPAAIRPGRDCINMLSMSGAWLIQYEEACGKQGDTL